MTVKLTPFARYALLVVVLIISFHSILTLTHNGYSKATSFSSFLRHSQVPHSVPEEYYSPIAGLEGLGATPSLNHSRVNAAIVMLARNTDIDGAVQSVRELEDKFNRKFGYPWVFLNEEEFSDDFKKRISNLIHGDVPPVYAKIPAEDWYQPASIDEEKAKAGRDQMVAENVIYGGSVSYRNMCRFNSGFFFRQPALQQYRYYWRVEPDVHFHCDIDFDPFRVMRDQKKTYGFTITLYEFEKTIPTLWSTVKDFIKEHPQYVAKDNAMGYLSENGGETYNLCHFWSNFEIADMDFWRSEAYTKFFDYLDARGGFYYERWGDAPVHSIAAALFARKDQIHFFNEIGYEHNPYGHCPRGDDAWTRGKCACDPKRNFDYDGYSCMRRWERLF